MSDWMWLALIGGAIYFLSRSKPTTGSSEVSGLGIGGRPRKGVPKTEAERLATHKTRYPKEGLPVRGTGLYRQGIL